MSFCSSDLQSAERLAALRTDREKVTHAVYHCDDDGRYYVVAEGEKRPGTGGTLVCFYRHVPSVERVAG